MNFFAQKFAYIKKKQYLCTRFKKQTLLTTKKITIMNKIYELVIVTIDETNFERKRNLLFSTKRKANENLKKFYYEGAVYTEDEIITHSYILERTLF